MQATPAENTTTTTAAAAPNQGRYIVVAVALCVVLSFLIVAGALYFFYQDGPTAFGVGLFTSFWGGGGFGVVLGIAVYNLRIEKLQALGKAARTSG